MRSNNFTPSYEPDRTINTFLTQKSRRKLSSGNQNDKLRAYQDIKEQMLGTFFIGKEGKKSRNKEKTPQRMSECTQYDFKIRRGKVWHGRPPVKIV